VQDRLVRVEPDHGKAGACRVRSEGPDIRAAVLAELLGDLEVAGGVAGRYGERPARSDQGWVQFDHAVAGALVQLRPCDIPAEIAGDPPLVVVRAVPSGSVRGRLWSDHHDGGMRRQVPGRRRAEHPVADDQEVHESVVPGARIAQPGARTPGGRRALLP